MSEKIQLRFGRNHVTLIRSATEVAARAAPGRSRAFGETVDALARSAGGKRSRHVGGFQILKVPRARMARTREALTESDAAGRPRPVFHTSARDRTPFVPLGTLYLRFAPGATEAEVDALLARHGCTRDGTVGSFLRVRSAQADTVAVAAALQQEALIATAEPDLVTPRRLLDFDMPTDAGLADQWHLENRGGMRGLKAGADARVVAAWQRLGGRGAPEAIVAVIDNGFDLAHLDLKGKAVSARDFNDEDAVVEPDDWGAPGAHGTACAGVAVAAVGAGKVVGVAPNARLMPLRMTADLSIEQVVRWFDHARERGAWVVSCSWKYKAHHSALPSPIAEAIHRCATEGRGGKGAIVVFAAGNDAKDINDPPRTLNGFAIHPEVLAVAASTSMDGPAAYSSTGREIAVCAPSSGAPGKSVVTTDLTDAIDAGGQPIARGFTAGDYATTFGGTSSACPVVAGVCALVLGAYPELTAAEVRDIIRRTARRIGDGYVDGHSRAFGHGCVDADAAVAAALAARAAAGAIS